MHAQTELPLLTRNEDVSDFVVGHFQDGRLQKVGALLFKMLSKKMTTCVHKLATGRAMQVAFNRFLSNEKSTTTEIEASLANRANENCIDRNHVLCVQDTVEVNYPRQTIKKSNFGMNRKSKESERDIKGFLAHPGLLLDAENGDILGLSSLKVWTRNNNESTKMRGQKAIEDKESYKWIETAEAAEKNITHAKVITVIGDRESDVYELFDRVPNENLHLLIRSRHPRLLTNGLRITEQMDTISPSGSYEIILPAITGVRQSRKATIALKYSEIDICVPSNIPSTVTHSSIKVTCIEAEEISEVPKKEKAIFWRLLTTHRVDNFLTAQQIVLWYTWRWNVEQIFRTMKKKGLKIEDSEIESVEGLLKLFMLSIAAAIKVLCLVNARDGKTKRPAKDIFSHEELQVLTAVLLKVNGRTKKQQNPHQTNTLSWASWIIARLGGWNGYACESPPGPITMYSGMEIFYRYVEGWRLAQ